MLLGKSGDMDRKMLSNQLFKELLKHEKCVLESLYGLSLVLYSMEKYDEARKYCEELVCQSPDNQQVLVYGCIDVQ